MGLYIKSSIFEDLGLREPDHYLNAAGSNLGETMGNIIAKVYEVLEAENLMHFLF